MKYNISLLKADIQDELDKIDLILLLDDFRSFRHKFRRTYAFELDWERGQVVAKKLPKPLN